MAYLTTESCLTNARKNSLSILTWNINGIRAAKIPLKQLLDGLNSDIICLQETKVTRDQLDEQTAIVDGYNSYFSFSKVRSGYSGVATFVRDTMTPIKAEQGLTIAHSGEGLTSDQRIGCYGNQMSYFTEDELALLDKEGRTVITEHTIKVMDKEKSLVIINVYCPRVDPEKPDRLTFKLRFYQLLQLRAEDLVKQGRHVIILGDMNTSHKKIDHCNPDNDEEFYLNPGRKWMDELLFNLEDPDSDPSVPIPKNDLKFDSHSGALEEIDDVSSPEDHHKFVDTYRLLHPTVLEAFTNWCSRTGARATNYGCRLDYVLADRELASATLHECIIMPEVQGSDHCPVRTTLRCSVIPAKKCPPLCTRYMPEFSGRQQKLHAFMTKKVVQSDAANEVKTSQSVADDAKNSQSEVNTSSQSFQRDCGRKLDLSNFIEDGHSDLNPSTMSVEMRLQVHNTKASKTPLCKRSSGNSASQSKRTKVDSMPQTKMTNFVVTKDPLAGIQGSTGSAIKQSNLLNFFTKGLQVVESKASDNNLKSPSRPPVATDVNIAAQSKELLPFGETVVSLVTCIPDQINTSQTATKSSSNAWKTMLKGPPQAPLCSGHSEPCVLRDVKKDGPNKGRQFWVCNRPQGHKTNPAARCEHFTWISVNKR